MKHPRSLLAFTLVLAMTGCATTHSPAETKAKRPATGSSSYDTVLPPDTARYHLALGQVASGAQPIEHASPAYPAAALHACAPRVDVPALVVVNASGAVEDVRFQPAGAETPFEDAVRAAVTRWRYEPLLISHMAANAEGDSHVVDQKTQPFSLNYVFHFQCHAGQAEVTSAPAG